MFLLGFIAFRLGIFDRTEQRRRLIVGLMAVGVASWVLASWFDPLFGRGQPPAAGDSVILSQVIAFARSTFRLVRPEWLAFTIMGAVLLFGASRRKRIRSLSLLAWPGRMALTNYALQVIFLDVMFTPHGFGVPLTPLMVPVGAVVLFVALSAFSRWWLQRYRYGPLEWGWRSVTYWQPQPMRIGARTPGPVLAPV